MDYLLDTHVALWWWANDSNLPKSVADIVSDSENTIYFSAISGYEMLLKNRLGKLQLPPQLIDNLADEVGAEGWVEKTVTLSASARAAKFEAVHRDPFDRILAAQAIDAGIPILSKDGALDAFKVDRVWHLT